MVANGKAMVRGTPRNREAVAKRVQAQPAAGGEQWLQTYGGQR